MNNDELNWYQKQKLESADPRILIADYEKQARSIGGRPRSERRLENRLAQLPENRICPKCQQLKLNKRQWVVIDGEAYCRSCHWKQNVKQG